MEHLTDDGRRPKHNVLSSVSSFQVPIFSALVTFLTVVAGHLPKAAEAGGAYFDSQFREVLLCGWPGTVAGARGRRLHSPRSREAWREKAVAQLVPLFLDSIQDSSNGGGADNIQGGFLFSVTHLWKHPKDALQSVSWG